MKLRLAPKAGFTLIEIMIVVGIISLLAAISIPNFIHARATSQASACINNLRKIDDAVQQYALEKNKSGVAVVSSTVVIPYLGRTDAGAWPKCPAAGTYSVTTVADKPTCTKSDLGHVLPE